MEKFFNNYDHDELLYLIHIIDTKIMEIDERCQFLRDFKDEILTYLSNDKEG